MEIEVTIMIGAVLFGLLALLSSKLVRTICFESILHPRDHCRLEVCNGEVAVNAERKDK